MQCQQLGCVDWTCGTTHCFAVMRLRAPRPANCSSGVVANGQTFLHHAPRCTGWLNRCVRSSASSITQQDPALSGRRLCPIGPCRERPQMRCRGPEGIRGIRRGPPGSSVDGAAVLGNCRSGSASGYQRPQCLGERQASNVRGRTSGRSQLRSSSRGWTAVAPSRRNPLRSLAMTTHLTTGGDTKGSVWSRSENRTSRLS